MVVKVKEVTAASCNKSKSNSDREGSKISGEPSQVEIIWGKTQGRHDTLSRVPWNQDHPPQGFLDNLNFTPSALF